MAHPFIFDLRTYIYTYMHAFNQALERPKQKFLAETFLGVGGGHTHPFWNILVFTPPHPLLKGGDTMTKHY